MRVEDHERRAALAIEAKSYEEAMRLLRPLAERGSEYALLALGWIYETGATGVSNREAARAYYEGAAANGSASACLNLGRLLMADGATDRARAAFDDGIRRGNEECGPELARLDDYEIERRAARAVEAGAYEEAERLLRPLAERDSEYALLTLGWIRETGGAGDCDWDAARRYYERAAARGSASAHCSLGSLFLREGEEERARGAFETGAELGDEGCKAELVRSDDARIEALAHAAGDAGNSEEAERLLRPLAERDSEYALLTLGWIYERGATGAADKQAARRHYERAAAQGSAAAYFQLGRLFWFECEIERARAAYAAGAELGDIACMHRVGRMMVEGRGGPAEPAAGREWLEKAAAQGHFFGRRMLLHLEARQAGSVFKRLFVGLKVLILAARAAAAMAKDPRSDRLRR
jgi:TPR repeat protein